MRQLLYACLAITLLMSCAKGNNAKVELYMLSSFQIHIDTSVYPATQYITDAVLDDIPLVADKDIRAYVRSTHAFKLYKDIKPQIRDYGPGKAFAVTVNKQPVYYGKIHPMYLSSITLGLATFDPLSFTMEDGLMIRYVTMPGSANLDKLDKRNDSRIMSALMASARLK